MSRPPGSTSPPPDGTPVVGWAAAALSDVPTPYLALDIEAMERNIAVARRLAGETAIRPHFKAHKCTEILRRQLRGGAAGVTCATAEEAAVLVAAGFDDILIANEVIPWPAARAVARLATEAQITVAVDSAPGLSRIGRCAADAGAQVGVLLDIDVGQHRCGLEPGSPELLALADAVASHPALALRGVMGYDGQAQHADADARGASTRRVAATLRAELDRLAAGGHVVDVVSGAGTGTLADAATAGVLTEIQAGSYALMDGEYGALGLGFEQALFCIATVISRHADGRAVLDAGLKALSGDAGLWTAARPDIVTVGASDEHTTIDVRDGTVAIGDLVALIPAHVDPTMNLHACVHAFAGDGRPARWAIDTSRRAAT